MVTGGRGAVVTGGRGAVVTGGRGAVVTGDRGAVVTGGRGAVVTGCIVEDTINGQNTYNNARSRARTALRVAAHIYYADLL